MDEYSKPLDAIAIPTSNEYALPPVSRQESDPTQRYSVPAEVDPLLAQDFPAKIHCISYKVYNLYLLIFNR